MFQVGALDPRVGNDRRNQLLQKLMQQFMQQQGMGVPGQPSLPTNLMRPMRDAAGFSNVGGTATRPADVLRTGGRPEFSFSNFIPPGLLPSLGPGGIDRAPQSAMSPEPGVPVPGIGHGGFPTAPPPAGTPIGADPVSASAIAAQQSANAQASQNATAQATGIPATQQPIQASNAGLTAQQAMANSIAQQQLAIQMGVHPTGMAGPITTTPSGAIPLGNGVFLNPDGTISGGITTTPMGGRARAV